MLSSVCTQLTVRTCRTIYSTVIYESSHLHHREWIEGNLLTFLWYFFLFLSSVPSVPQDVSAISTGPTNVSVTWMEPAVFYCEHTHHTTAVHVLLTCNGIATVTDTVNVIVAMSLGCLQIAALPSKYTHVHRQLVNSM